MYKMLLWSIVVTFHPSINIFFYVDAFVQQNGFHIFSCLISGPHRAEKFRTTILGQRWRQIKLAEYSTAFPSAAATHFAATSPTEPNTYTEPHICRERQVDKRKKSILSHPWLLDARTKCLFQVAARAPPGLGSMNGV